jgi:PAB1-binding protein PBP1
MVMEMELDAKAIEENKSFRRMQLPPSLPLPLAHPPPLGGGAPEGGGGGYCPFPPKMLYFSKPSGL